MTEHQNRAHESPDRGPGTEAEGRGRPTETEGRGHEQPGAGGGYREAQAGPLGGQAPGGAAVYGHPGQGGAAGLAHLGGYGQQHPSTGALPPGYAGYGQAQYAQSAAGPSSHVPFQGDGFAPHHAAPPHAAAMPFGHYVGYTPPPLGAYPPDGFQAIHQGYAYGAARGAGHAHGASMSDLVTEVASGGNGLSTLSKMLNFDDPDFWKGALVGAAAVLLLTSDSVQHALFNSGGNGNGDSGKESGT